MAGRDKAIRKLVRLVNKANGRVEKTSNSHLRIIGPRGVAIVGMNSGETHNWNNALTHIRRNAGLDIRASPP